MLNSIYSHAEPPFVPSRLVSVSTTVGVLWALGVGGRTDGRTYRLSVRARAYVRARIWVRVRVPTRIRTYVCVLAQASDNLRQYVLLYTDRDLCKDPALIHTTRYR